MFATAKTSQDVEELEHFLDESIRECTEGLIVKTLGEREGGESVSVAFPSCLPAAAVGCPTAAAAAADCCCCCPQRTRMSPASGATTGSS